MRLFPTLLFAVIISLISFSARAATGCLSNSSTYTYINPEGVIRNGVPSYYHRYESDRIISTSTYCVVNTGAGCYINSTRSGYTSSYGTIVQFNTVNNCPIDDYTGFILGGFALFGFIYIKRKSANTVIAQD